MTKIRAEQPPSGRNAAASASVEGADCAKSGWFSMHRGGIRWLELGAVKMHMGPDIQPALSWRACESVKASEAAVGMWYFLQRAFRNFLEPSSRAAAALGPNTLQGDQGASETMV